MTTLSYACLELSKEAYQEILAAMRKAGYDHALKPDATDPEFPRIVMTGLAVRRRLKMEAQCPKCNATIVLERRQTWHLRCNHCRYETFVELPG